MEIECVLNYLFKLRRKMKLLPLTIIVEKINFSIIMDLTNEYNGKRNRSKNGMKIQSIDEVIDNMTHIQEEIVWGD